jgi:hypothetical protein
MSGKSTLTSVSDLLATNPLIFGGHKEGYVIEQSSNVGFGLLKLAGVSALIGYPLWQIYYNKIENPWWDVLKMNTVVLGAITIADYNARCVRTRDQRTGLEGVRPRP